MEKFRIRDPGKTSRIRNTEMFSNKTLSLLLVIEHLPNDLRDRFTEMREIDLGVENTVDSLEAR